MTAHKKALITCYLQRRTFGTYNGFAYPAAVSPDAIRAGGTPPCNINTKQASHNIITISESVAAVKRLTTSVYNPKKPTKSAIALTFK